MKADDDIADAAEALIVVIIDPKPGAERCEHEMLHALKPAASTEVVERIIDRAQTMLIEEIAPRLERRLGADAACVIAGDEVAYCIGKSGGSSGKTCAVEVDVMDGVDDHRI